jgi:hypothetical protein
MKSETSFQEYLYETLIADSEVNDEITAVHTYEDEGILTNNKGLVVHCEDGSIFQLTIKRYR